MVTSYYILGSKYEEGKNNWVDMYPAMQEKGVVSVGWFGEKSLKRFYGKPESEIIDYLSDAGEPPKCYNTLRYFLRLKPGDVIAIKDSGSPLGKQPYLSIRGFAIVTERDSAVYGHDRKLLGHTINVDFIDIPKILEFKRGGYGRTIHKLSNQDHIGEIFQLNVQALNIVDPQSDDPSLNTDQQSRKGSQPYVADAAHNILQKTFYRYLCNVHGKNNLKLEKEYVDIILEQSGKSTLYEIKPYNSVIQCMRAALGQLVHYCYNYCSTRNTPELAIVGPAEPSEEEKAFIEFIKANITIPIKYICFSDNRAHEY
ncbi:MAG: hypothetical protein ABIH76_08380 [Candidatus Bathyarchaeota archaeon]